MVSVFSVVEKDAVSSLWQVFLGITMLGCWSKAVPSVGEIYVPFEKNCLCTTGPDHKKPSDHMSELPIMRQALSNPPRHNIRPEQQSIL